MIIKCALKFPLFSMQSTFGSLFSALASSASYFLLFYHYYIYFLECGVFDFVIGRIGTCQGVIALNMEDGTLHRFHAGSTILATGVFHFLFPLIRYMYYSTYFNGALTYTSISVSLPGLW